VRAERAKLGEKIDVLISQTISDANPAVVYLN